VGFPAQSIAPKTRLTILLHLFLQGAQGAGVGHTTTGDEDGVGNVGKDEVLEDTEGAELALTEGAEDKDSEGAGDADAEGAHEDE